MCACSWAHITLSLVYVLKKFAREIIVQMSSLQSLSCMDSFDTKDKVISPVQMQLSLGLCITFTCMTT